jgi:hypothetical protein
MEAVQTSETSVNSYQSTRRYNPEDSHLHSHRRGNFRSYMDISHLSVAEATVTKQSNAQILLTGTVRASDVATDPVVPILRVSVTSVPP